MFHYRAQLTFGLSAGAEMSVNALFSQFLETTIKLLPNFSLLPYERTASHSINSNSWQQPFFLPHVLSRSQGVAAWQLNWDDLLPMQQTLVRNEETNQLLFSMATSGLPKPNKIQGQHARCMRFPTWRSPRLSTSWRGRKGALLSPKQQSERQSPLSALRQDPFGTNCRQKTRKVLLSSHSNWNRSRTCLSTTGTILFFGRSTKIPVCSFSLFQGVACGKKFQAGKIPR